MRSARRGLGRQHFRPPPALKGPTGEERGVLLLPGGRRQYRLRGVTRQPKPGVAGGAVTAKFSPPWSQQRVVERTTGHLPPRPKPAPAGPPGPPTAGLPNLPLPLPCVPVD